MLYAVLTSSNNQSDNETRERDGGIGEEELKREGVKGY
jgi:hypothetical protein